MDTLVGFLSQGFWDGIAAILAVVALAIAIYFGARPLVIDRRRQQALAKALDGQPDERREERRKIVGRDQTVHDLRALLMDAKQGAITPVATGIGGAGKTTLARRYDQLYSSEYAMVRWLRAETEQGLVAGLARICLDLNPTFADQPENVRAELAKGLIEQFASEKPCLIVYDNAVNPEGVERWKVRGAKCHVLVTSRHPDWSGAGFEAMKLPTLAREASVTLLRNEAGRDDPGFADLAEALGDLPLALVQAGEWLRANRGVAAHTYQADIAKLRQRHALPGMDSDPDRTSAAVVEKTLELLTKDGRVLLDILAWWAPQGLESWPFHEAAKVPWPLLMRYGLPRHMRRMIRDGERVERAFEELRQRALLEDGEAEGTYELHRVFGLVVRLMQPRQGQGVARAAAALVRACYPGGVKSAQNPVHWPDCRRLTPHGAAIWQWAEALWDGAWGRPGWAAMDALLNQMGVYYSSQENATAEIAAWRARLALTEARVGEADRALPVALGNLGAALGRAKAFAEAEEMLDRAVDLDRKYRSEGEELPGSMIQRAQLEFRRHEAGAAADQAPDLEDALLWLEEARDLFIAAQGAAHADVGFAWNAIGYLHRLAGRGEDAATAYVAAYEIMSAVPDGNRAHLGGIAMNAGASWLQAKEAEKAEPLLREAWEIFGEIYRDNPGHSRRKTAAGWYSICLLVLGEEAAARDVAEAAGLDWEEMVRKAEKYRG